MPAPLAATAAAACCHSLQLDWKHQPRQRQHNKCLETLLLLAACAAPVAA